jgi:hypothetical protein
LAKIGNGFGKMAAAQKIGTVWRHRVMVAGTRYSGTFDTKAAALAWEAEKRVTTPKGKLGLTKACADAFDKYELEVSKNKRGYRWEALRLTAMAETDLGKVKMADVSTTHVTAWRDQRLKQVAPGSVTREMNLLSHVLLWRARSGSGSPRVQQPM